MVNGRAKAALDRIAQMDREMSERRSLRDRKTAEAKAQATENLQKQGKVIERSAQHLGELGRRQREAQGWATAKTMGEKDNVMAFGSETDEPAAAETETGRHRQADMPPTPQQGGSQSARDLQAERRLPRAESSEVDAAPTMPPARRRPSRGDEFDDDDFSNNNWLS